MNAPPIGIIGGMGPHAGLALAHRILDATQAATDQDHVPMALLSFPSIPDRSSFLAGEGPNPGPHILRIAFDLHTIGARVIGMPCNTAHAPAILDPVLVALQATAPDVQFVHLIEATVEAVRTRCPDARRVGLLATRGTYATGIYQRAISARNLTCIVPEETVRETHVRGAIYDRERGIKAQAAPVTDWARDELRTAMLHLQDAGADCIVLGCTELPLAFPPGSETPLPIVDSLTALAAALLRAAYPERSDGADL